MSTTPYWEHVKQRVQTIIFVFSHHFSCYNWISVTTNIKNSGLLVRIQDGDEENSSARRKLRANWGQFSGCLGPHWKQIEVKRWGFIIPRWNLPGLFTWCKGKIYWIPGNSRNILEFLNAAWSYRALEKNSTSISQEKFTGYCREFKGKWANYV